jgi:hypothetical protein
MRFEDRICFWRYAMEWVQKLYEDFAMRLGKNGKKKGWRNGGGRAGIYDGRENSE